MVGRGNDDEEEWWWGSAEMDYELYKVLKDLLEKIVKGGKDGRRWAGERKSTKAGFWVRKELFGNYDNNLT